VFAALDPQARIEWLFDEGAAMAAGSTVCRIEADARALLSAERPALNFLQLLSGTASATRRHVRRDRRRVAQPARLRDPGHAQDPAGPAPGAEVRGARRRRPQPALALWHGILIKENHIAAAGGVPQVRPQALALNAGVEIQIEVETLDQLRQALAAGATSVLLDNFPLPRVREAVAINAGRALLEVSGGVTLDSSCATSPPPASTASRSAS
jgi:nicotinate-nucleotide pyrophosphorylase (carboxylating)